MAEDVMTVIERAVYAVTARKDPLSPAEGIEFRRALDDLAGRIECAVQALRQLVETANPEAPVQDLNLTPRELEILSHLAEGRSNGEIALQCWISENTVKFHLKNVFRKLQIRDRGQAIMIARAIRRRSDSPLDGR